MRIAFDLDDTLIPTTTKFSVGSKSLGIPANLIFKEELRNGAPELMKKLARNHEVWIYTTSLRKEFYLKMWFKFWGVRITSVVNQQEHNDAVKGNSVYSRFSKTPTLFGIDLLVDDLPGVEIECNTQGCESLIICPNDKNWTEKVAAKVGV
ncbi:hypothetical protein [Aliikangiella sp. IMCC44359]|uniref:hypothetical protein n=1 Tax=Aliikangiella sp. IMCC44359 TaxID=3459125 RepID=UPI00403AB4EC